MIFFFVSDFPVVHSTADVAGCVAGPRTWRKWSTSSSKANFLCPASPALILYPEGVVFFLRAKDARGQPQGLVRRRRMECNARIAVVAATVAMRNPPVGVCSGFLL